MKLVLIRGLPGSGKSTKAKKLAPNENIFEADQFFIDKKTGEYKFKPEFIHLAHQQCQNKTIAAMEKEISPIVVSNTFTTYNLGKHDPKNNIFTKQIMKDEKSEVY